MLNFFYWKRRSGRKIVGIEAEIISDSKKGFAGILDNTSTFCLRHINWYQNFGVIENLSMHGICLKTFPQSSALDYAPGTILELKIPSFSGETLNLRCMVKWSQKIPPDDLTYKMGMKIINPSMKYSKLLKIL